MTFTLTQINLMKKWIKEVSQDISIVCITSCPICDMDFDAEGKEDSYAIHRVVLHIESTHTFNELKEYVKK